MASYRKDQHDGAAWSKVGEVSARVPVKGPVVTPNRAGGRLTGSLVGSGRAGWCDLGLRCWARVPIRAVVRLRLGEIEPLKDKRT
jgi:hypothetical protein